MSNFVFVLVRPRDPNNIGACARAIGNFGFTKLRVVNPFSPNWREAVSAVGAEDILKKAKLFDTLPQALADCHYSLATTALKNRQLKQDILALPDLNKSLPKKNKQNIALIFGPEKTGLSNEEIALCDGVLHIPTASRTPSVNLAQAVILCAYELSKIKKAPAAKTKEISPTWAEKNLLLEEFLALSQKSSLKDNIPLRQRKETLRLLLNKQNINRKDLFFLKKLIKQINSLIN